MSVTKVELKNGFFVEIDPLNYTLKRLYMGKDKNDNPKEQVKVHGYFGDMRDAIEKFMFLTQLDAMDGETLSFEKYVEMVEKANETALQGLGDVLSRYSARY